MQLHWDIFCRVIDNFGDIGVCWRLARQLAAEHGKKVRLWLDDLHSLQPLCPMVNVSLAKQHCLGVEIRQWTEHAAVDRVGEVVIEAFACELPAAYVAAMAAATPKPCWINLEYLTAEQWAEGCHGMASPHPSLPLVKYFFFPGFSGGTGGLLREGDLLTARDVAMARQTKEAGLDISLFCYDAAPVGGLLDALAASPIVVRLHVAAGKAMAAVTAHLGEPGACQRGNLHIMPFDFLPQDDYDHLLWDCDINFVRGEDSFVRAQWAGKPFVWQIYRQDDDAHLDKLQAFLALYSNSMAPEIANAAVNLFQAWNSGTEFRRAWMEFLKYRPEIAKHNRHWAAQLAEMPDLTKALVKFCTTKV